jgi:hypothetical protein
VIPFTEGLAAVLLPLHEPGAPEAESAGSGLPQVKWGYIDRQGQTIIEPRFYEAKPFRHGLAEVKESPRHLGFIDQMGKYVWEMVLPGKGGRVQ